MFRNFLIKIFFEQESGISISAYLENCDITSSRSATLPRHHRRQLSSDLTFATSYTGSRENSPLSRYVNSSYATSTLPRKYRSRDSSRKSSRTNLTKPSTTTTTTKPEENIEIKHDPTKLIETIDSSTTESPIKTSHKYNSCDEGTDNTAESPVKNLSSIDNSGPSSIESHKSSKTGSSLTSGPSSLESHKTVIHRQLTPSSSSSPKTSLDVRKNKHRKDTTKCKTTTTTVQKSTTQTLTSLPHSNSFTLQVTTNQGGINLNNKTAATINGGASSNTKIFVQNSPVRSVITFENGQSENKNPNLVIINGTEASIIENGQQQNENSNVKYPQAKNTNQSKESQINLNNSRDPLTEQQINNEIKNEAMNNNRKLSLQLPSRDGLSYHNLIKNVSSSSYNQYNSNSNPDSPNTFREFSKNYDSSPPSPTKSFEGLPLSSSGKYIKNEVGSKTSLEKSFYGLENGKVLEKNIIGSEPNICYKDRTLTRENSNQQFPSLSDLTFNFTSLAAQKILKGVSINSVDTLVELNLAASVEKQKNCDVVHTDFGLF